MSVINSPVDIAIPQSLDWAQRVSVAAKTNMQRYDNCTQSIVAVFMQDLAIEDPMVVRAASAFFGGMLSSLTCGVHSAGVMIIGLMAGRQRLEDGIDGLYPLVMPVQKLIRRLNRKLGSHSCLELTGVDFTDLNKAMAFRQSQDHEACVERVTTGAGIIAELLQELNLAGDLFRADRQR